jgi:hypothetical protein
MLSAGAIVIENALLVVAARLSETPTVKLAVPAEDGVPLMTPVVEFSASPAGSAPTVMDQVYGAVPPAATKVTV